MSVARWLESLQDWGCVELEESSGFEEEIGDPVGILVVGDRIVARVEAGISVRVADADTLGAGAWKVSLPGFVQSTMFSVGLKQQAQS